ncbi:MAG: 1-deoxy-D-xylulose-5-phosphate synthase [Nitrospirae bacterium]|nr:1-deoxy-D-xylulose-5-phosphate synthase [Candidatus Manganitrophaceae bacterium]
MRLLDQINSPADLKKIPRESLPQLAQEVREKILEVVADKGGHLGASLGAVELTIALHTVFDPPQDRFVWDTGHQAYPHKLLTGRRDQFHTLRQYQGISGFLSRAESPYDTFGAGHAGTAISAALGMAEAREQLGGKYHVIAITGDGAITAGMAYEALNHAGALHRDMIVILNDNEMSISKNVGAISAYLARIITGPLYTKVRSETATLLKNIPKIGQPMLKVARRAEESVKGLITPGLLFEEMGFRYIGPIDGHRLDHLLTTFENIKQLEGPLLVHLITKKGKGYAPAEGDPAGFHGTSAFNLDTGLAKKKSSAPNYTGIFAKQLIALAKKDRRIVAITAAMPEGTGVAKFAKEFPERSYDVGIAEQHAVTLAAGMAADGLRPVVAIYSTFLQRGFDQIAHDVALQNLPVTFCLDRAGLVGEDGPTHNGVFDIAYLKGLPNMILMAPKDENELQQMLTTALNYPGPVAIRYPRGEAVGVPLEEPAQPLPIGKGELLRGDLQSNSGHSDSGHSNNEIDVALIALGSMVYPSLSAATLLEREGVSVAVVNARFAKPIDRELLVAVAQRCRRIVTLEEHSLAGGFGESVLALLEEERSAGRIPAVDTKRIGLPDQFIEHGAQKVLREKLGLDPERIAATVLDFLKVGSEDRAIGLGK